MLHGRTLGDEHTLVSVIRGRCTRYAKGNRRRPAQGVFDHGGEGRQRSVDERPTTSSSSAWARLGPRGERVRQGATSGVLLALSPPAELQILGSVGDNVSRDARHATDKPGLLAFQELVFVLILYHRGTETWPINPFRWSWINKPFPRGRPQQAHTKSLAKLLRRRSYRSESGVSQYCLCVPFPLGEPAGHDEKPTISNAKRTHTRNISHPWETQPYGFQAASSVTRAAHGLRIQR
jgi:hypothetical protein